VKGDEAGFLAPLHASKPQLRKQYEMLYANLRALHVSGFSQTAQPRLDVSAAAVNADCVSYVYRTVGA
jgi:hypothetical protein